MTYVEFTQLIADFAFIQVVEATFIVIMTMILSKIKLDKEKVIMSIAICSIVSTILLPFGYNGIANRIIFIVISGLVIAIVNKCKLRKLQSIYTSLFVVSMIMMVVGFISLAPLLYILGVEITTLQENIYLMLLYSIPVRCVEYIVCYLTFMRFGGKYEKINRENQSTN